MGTRWANAVSASPPIFDVTFGSPLFQDHTPPTSAFNVKAYISGTLLLGGTGNLGLRCIQALLAHKHVVILYVRNPSKLRLLVSPSVIEKTRVVVGDATDAEGIKKAIVDYDIEAIVDVAANQVLPWKEFLLSKIAKAVTDAAVAVGKDRGAPLRAWLVSGIGVLQYPGTPNEYLLQD